MAVELGRVVVELGTLTDGSEAVVGNSSTGGFEWVWHDKGQGPEIEYVM